MGWAYAKVVPHSHAGVYADVLAGSEQLPFNDGAFSAVTPRRQIWPRSTGCCGAAGASWSSTSWPQTRASPPASYHVSPYNTFTGRLTAAMLDEVLLALRDVPD